MMVRGGTPLLQSTKWVMEQIDEKVDYNATESSLRKLLIG